MPELPEVEVLRLSLSRTLPGERVGAITVRDVRLRDPVRPKTLRSLVEGRRVQELRRRSKYLLIDLEGGTVLVVHLGMSGRLTVDAVDEPVGTHEHVSFSLESGRRLRFRDPRRFGMVFAVAAADLKDHPRFRNLGIEPLDGSLDGEHLRRAARGRRGPVKTFLMDAAVVVGVGNIYASEALFRAGVHPRRAVNRISLASWTRIADAVRETLADAIAQGGTTLNDFTDGEGNSGYFQVVLAAYGRQGEPCRRCGGDIRRLVQSGRATYYCPGCQR